MTNQLFNKDELSKFTKIFSNLSEEDEFEIMFGGYTKTNSINMKQFLDILKYLKLYADNKKFKIIHTETLDISYNYDNKNFHTYRISIDGVESINKLMSTLHKRENHIIFSVLAAKLLSNEKENLSIINKKKDFDNTYNLDKHDIRVRLAKEQKVTKAELGTLIKLDNISKIAIMLRMKSRVSVIIENNSEVELRIDLTSVKQCSDINKIQKINPNYEMEIDFNKKKKLSSAKEKEYLNKVLSYVDFVKKIIEQSNSIISRQDKENVMKVYNRLLYGEESYVSKSLYGPQVKSLEAVHIVDNLPNKYSVTDKADGDRCIGLITNNKLYLIFANLEIKDSGVNVKNMDDTIIDGEYIYNQQNNKYIYTTWDILFYKGENVQNNASLEERYQKLNEVIRNGFDFNFKFKKYDGAFDISKIESYYKNNVEEYLKLLDKKLKTIKDDTCVCQKYFIFVLGGSDNEIFKYSDILWNMYTKTHANILPYILDGLIYTPVQQIYTKSLKETKNRTYKWKPPNKNSIDFYIRFEKDPQTGKYLNVYDDSNEGTIEGNTYNIINLHVGKVVNNIEIPVLFRKYDNLHIAKISDSSGMVRDVEGDLLQDNTVVEFYYNNDSDLPQDFRWVPIKTRYDKTESVLKHKKKYGNNVDIADAIWNSIQQNVTINDIEKLGNDELYEQELADIKSRIDASIVAAEKQKDVYYQKTTDFATPLRNFNNYIKSNIIFTYCSPKISNDKLKKLAILDLGCGRGGDIQKFFHSKVGKYVGFDPDHHGIHSSTNGALSRYNAFRRKMPNFPKMDFLIADASSELNYDSQLKSIGKMSVENKNLLESIFGTDKDNLNNIKFDVFNCNLMIHFVLKNDTTWNNFCTNINNFMADDGYLLITTFDGDILHKNFQNKKGNIKELYNSDGTKKTFFEFKSNYDYKSSDINRTGLSYNAFVSMFKEDDNFDTEYLVPHDFLVSSLKEKCNMSLIESNSFDKIYEQQKMFFENIAPKEENSKSKAYFMKIAEFYNMDDSVNKAGYEFCKLHKYYIFKKETGKAVKNQKPELKKKVTKEKVTKEKVTKVTKEKVKKGGSKQNNLIDKYLNMGTTIDI